MTEELLDREDDILSSTKENITESWFPEVAELEACSRDIEADPATYLELFLYFASDPFQRVNPSDAHDEEYAATVKYCRKHAYQMIDKLLPVK